MPAFIFDLDGLSSIQDPSLFIAAAEKLGSSSEETLVVGDSVWDMLSGG